MKNLNVLIKNRTRYLAACSALPQTNCATARPDAVQGVYKMCGKILGLVFRPQIRKDIYINMCRQILKFSNYSQKICWPQCFGFSPVGDT